MFMFYGFELTFFGLFITVVQWVYLFIRVSCSVVYLDFSASLRMFSKYFLLNILMNNLSLLVWSCTLLIFLYFRCLIATYPLIFFFFLQFPHIKQVLTCLINVELVVFHFLIVHFTVSYYSYPVAFFFIFSLFEIALSLRDSSSSLCQTFSYFYSILLFFLYFKITLSLSTTRK